MKQAARRSFTAFLFGMMVGVFTLMHLSEAYAASAAEIDARVEQALEQFYKETSAGKKLAKKAVAILVFPKVKKGGIGIGGEYGQGALLRRGKTEGYYSIKSASIGLQLGFQVKTELIMFMTKDALKGFLGSKKWEAGVDASVAVVEWGAGGEIDTQNIDDPIIGFIFSNKGLMYNLSLEGAKISKLHGKG